MDYLQKEAISQPEISDPHYVPFEKKTRGKVFKPKQNKKSTGPLLPDDLSDVLDGASEDELLELAGLCIFYIYFSCFKNKYAKLSTKVIISTALCNI